MAQLGIVSALLGVIVGSVGAGAGLIALMIIVAAFTSARRITRHPGGWWAAFPISPAPLPAAAGLVAAGVVPSTGIAVIPTAGILIGRTMTATSLAGRRALDELTARRGAVEAALSLGVPGRDAAAEIARPGAARSLVPALDQTRTVGARHAARGVRGDVAERGHTGAGRRFPVPLSSSPAGRIFLSAGA
ncbi:ABC transporter permease [Pseudonocardia sp. H11422]|uniref:ABC transporter permease n=1 Tax=Pseudonocardia sp. H11422 TaxID=2835866 RepID=UPI001BDD7354